MRAKPDDRLIRSAVFDWLRRLTLRFGDALPWAELKPGQAPPYEDRVEDDGLLSYRYRGTDPRHRDNVGLRRAYTEAVPLVYFHGMAKGVLPSVLAGVHPR